MCAAASVSPSAPTPVIARIWSVAQLPAARPVPVQARKGAGRGKNPFLFAMLFEKNIEIFSDPNPSVLCVFSICPPRFRGWTGAGSAGGYNAPGLPDLSGYVPAVVMSESTVSATGPFSVGPVTYTDAVNPGQGQVHRSITFSASHVSAIYGASPTVMPASVDLPVILYLGNYA